jgi:hypothetical protein
VRPGGDLEVIRPLFLLLLPLGRIIVTVNGWVGGGIALIIRIWNPKAFPPSWASGYPCARPVALAVHSVDQEITSAPSPNLAKSTSPCSAGGMTVASGRVIADPSILPS